MKKIPCRVTLDTNKHYSELKDIPYDENLEKAAEHCAQMIDLLEGEDLGLYKEERKWVEKELYILKEYLKSSIIREEDL